MKAQANSQYKRHTHSTVKTCILWVILFSIPLLIAITWGTGFDESAYANFHYALNLSSGHNWIRDPINGDLARLPSPLYVLILALPGALGIPLLPVGLLLSALGWGCAALGLHFTGQAIQRPIVATVAAPLLVANPIVALTSGTELSWTIALAWAAIALSIRKRWGFQAIALALMLLVHFDFGTLVLAVLLLIIQLSEKRSIPIITGALARWRNKKQPGLHRILLAILLGVAFSTLSGSTSGFVTLITTGLFLVGWGIDLLIQWIEKNNTLRVSQITILTVRLSAPMLLALAISLPLGIIQLSMLWQNYQSRPVVKHTLEQQAADWLRTHSEPGASVFGPARVGFLSDRSSMPWSGSDIRQATIAALLQTLSETQPQYCVSLRSLGWDWLMRTGWFKDHYAPVQTFESPYDSASPLTIWRYQASAFDLGERQPLDARLPSDVDWVGYKYWPDRIQPGDAVYVTLYLQATRPLTSSLRTVVRIVSPSDGVGWAQQDTIIPRSVPLGWWQSGQVIAERFTLTTTKDIPIGAHHLDISVITPQTAQLLPIYHDDDETPLDEFRIGYVVVPWRGTPDITRPINANLDNQITLLGYTAPDTLPHGTNLDVTLYWEAQQPPQGDYVVFVHLLDASGQLVASHDGPPMNGDYSTEAWLPGEIIADTHHIAMDPEIPAGSYWLQVGMYAWPSLERLPAWDQQGAELADRVIVLQSIEIQ